MLQIFPSNNEYQWPRHAVPTVDCRKRDLVVRLADWMDDEDEPSYDVEVYIGGVYDWTESQSFTMFEHHNRETCKRLAIAYAHQQILKLL